jgi:ribosomal protein S25
MVSCDLAFLLQRNAIIAAHKNRMRSDGLLESGRLKQTESEGSSRQKYLNSETNPTEDTVFITNIKKEVSQKYAGRTFTAEQFAADFNVSMSCAYRRIGRLYKRGWLSYEKVGKVQIYTIVSEE